jgi:hypothetical protein
MVDKDNKFIMEDDRGNDKDDQLIDNDDNDDDSNKLKV